MTDLVSKRALSEQLFGAGDYQDFDARLPAKVWKYVDDFTDYLLGNDDASVRHTLIWPTKNCIQIIGNKLVSTYGSLASGGVGTSYFGSVMSGAMIASGMSILIMKYNLDPKIFLRVYSDDNAEVGPERFPYDELQAVLAHYYGVNLTDAEKTGILRGVPIEEVTFLSRTIRNAGYDAPLSIKRIHSIIEFTCDFNPKTIQNMLNSFFLELTHHGREVFEEHRRILAEHSWTQISRYRCVPWAQALQMRLEQQTLLG
jgi:hypothetical protein